MIHDTWSRQVMTSDLIKSFGQAVTLGGHAYNWVFIPTTLPLPSAEFLHGPALYIGVSDPPGFFAFHSRGRVRLLTLRCPKRRSSFCLPFCQALLLARLDPTMGNACSSKRLAQDRALLRVTPKTRALSPRDRRPRVAVLHLKYN